MKTSLACSCQTSHKPYLAELSLKDWIGLDSHGHDDVSDLNCAGNGGYDHDLRVCIFKCHRGLVSINRRECLKDESSIKSNGECDVAWVGRSGGISLQVDWKILDSLAAFRVGCDDRQGTVVFNLEAYGVASFVSHE